MKTLFVSMEVPGGDPTQAVCDWRRCGDKWSCPGGVLLLSRSFPALCFELSCRKQFSSAGPLSHGVPPHLWPTAIPWAMSGPRLLKS